MRETEARHSLDVDLSDLKAELSSLNEDVEESFARAGRQFASNLREAARSGEADFRDLAKSIVEELATLSIRSVYEASDVGTGQQQATGSLNGVASALTQLALRGRRFS